MDTDKKKDLVFLNALTDALGRSEGQSPEDIKRDLEEDGVNVDSLMRDIMSDIKDISMKAKREHLDSVRERRLDMESEKNDWLTKIRAFTKEEILERIELLVDKLGPEVSYSCREFESKNTDDLRAMLEDLELALQRKKMENDIDEK